MGSFAWARLSLLEVVYQLDIENLRVKPNWATMFRLGSFLSAAQFLALLSDCNHFQVSCKITCLLASEHVGFPDPLGLVTWA